VCEERDRREEGQPAEQLEVGALEATRRARQRMRRSQDVCGSHLLQAGGELANAA
jgi:hypothetical protein